jgi:hypothetical protein
MSEKFVLLTEEEYNKLLHLKEQRNKNNFYHKEYIKNKFREMKQTKPDEYKFLMQKQNEANKKYKNKLLEELKKDEQKYKEYKEQIKEYNKNLRIQKKQLLLNCLESQQTKQE